MSNQKKIEPLVSEELRRKVKELGNLTRAEKAKACGYYSITKNGLERVNMKQFLNALIDAEGIELNDNNKANENGDPSSYPIAVQASRSINSNQIVKVNRTSAPTAKPNPLPQPAQQPEIEPVQEPQMEQVEQPEPSEPIVYLERLAEYTREESVYGSGWSLAQLMNEFNGR